MQGYKVVNQGANISHGCKWSKFYPICSLYPFVPWSVLLIHAVHLYTICVKCVMSLVNIRGFAVTSRAVKSATYVHVLDNVKNPSMQCLGQPECFKDRILINNSEIWTTGLYNCILLDMKMFVIFHPIDISFCHLLVQRKSSGLGL